MNKDLIAVLVFVVLAAVAGGAYYTTHQDDGTGAPVAGNTFNNAKVAQINFAPTSITGTSTSLLNSDANDRIVTDAFAACSGLTNMFSMTGGVATFNFAIATSSVAAPTASIFGTLHAAGNFTMATSTDNGYTATTTYTAPISRRWAAGTYMIVQVNATSSNAFCTAGVHYLAT